MIGRIILTAIAAVAWATVVFGAGGPLLPSSLYFGGASGNLFPNFFGGSAAASAQSFEGIGVIASLSTSATAIVQFNMPEVLPSGTAKLRLIAFANATTGVAKVLTNDGTTAVGSSLTVNATETQVSQTWSSANVIVENKITLTTAPVANNVYTVILTFQPDGWTLASISTWQPSIVWE